MSFYQKRDQIRDYLREEGFRPQIDKDGDLVFLKKNLSFVILLDDEDDSFYRVMLPNIDSFQKGSEEEIAAAAAGNIVNHEVKVAKIEFFPRGNIQNIHVFVEIFCETLEDFKNSIDRCAKSCLAAALLYKKKKEETSTIDEEADQPNPFE